MSPLLTNLVTIMVFGKAFLALAIAAVVLFQSLKPAAAFSGWLMIILGTLLPSIASEVFATSELQGNIDAFLFSNTVSTVANIMLLSVSALGAAGILSIIVRLEPSSSWGTSICLLFASSALSGLAALAFFIYGKGPISGLNISVILGGLLIGSTFYLARLCCAEADEKAPAAVAETSSTPAPHLLSPVSKNPRVAKKTQARPIRPIRTVALQS